MRALPYFAPDPSPVPAKIAAYLAERARTDAAPATVYTYKRVHLDFAAYCEQSEEKPFSTALCTVQTILDYKAYLRIRRMSAATVNKRLAAIKRLFRYAVAAGWIAADPTATAPRSPRAPVLSGAGGGVGAGSRCGCGHRSYSTSPAIVRPYPAVLRTSRSRMLGQAGEPRWGRTKRGQVTGTHGGCGPA